MKNTKDFFERLQSDEAFAKEIAEKVKEKTDAGEQDYKKVWIPIAAEYDYELSDKELDSMYEKAAGELSDEELGKIAGGTTPTIVVAITVYSVATATSCLTYYLTDDEK